MKQLEFCEYCMNYKEYKVNEINRKSILKDEEITYLAKEAICKECGNEIFVSKINSENLKAIYNKYRNKHNIIRISEIERIMLKYSVRKESLSLLLGFEKDTISRYLEGDMVCESHSDILKKSYKSLEYYSIMLETNKYKINVVDYNKSKKALKNLSNVKNTEEKIDAIIKYLLIRCNDITPFALQKLLYYVQGFYYMFTYNFLFEEDFMAYISGPTLKSISDRYELLGYEEINEDILNNDNLNLEDIERNVVEGVIKFYGCYSGNTLKQMTHNEAPWILTRKKLLAYNNNESLDIEIKKIINKDLIASYFNGLKDKYEMINILDIQKYSKNLFNKIYM